MAKSFKNYLSGQIGENLVAAELGRRGIVASILSGNMPDVDILAFRAGKSIGIQVKAFKTGSVSVNLADYLHIDLIDTVQKAYPVDPGLTTSCAVQRTGSRDFSLQDT
ncbi:MAG: hypothetical protein Q8Q26_08545 [Pseudorhodobacter sp.]|nr:hypothetical protein [Pseudorhodobacter sp.]